MIPPPWVENTQLGALRADDLMRPDLIVRSGRYLYRTLGIHLASGGMGTVCEMERRLDGQGIVEPVVGKTFQANYLQQIRSDEVTRRDHHINLAAVARITEALRSTHGNQTRAARAIAMPLRTFLSKLKRYGIG